MNKNVIIAFLMLSLCCLTACNTGRSGGATLLTPEQERLSHINMIDSLTLPSLLNLDSIEGRDKLASISAEAWMLIDDNTGFVISQKYANEPAFIKTARGRGYIFKAE